MTVQQAEGVPPAGAAVLRAASIPARQWGPQPASLNSRTIFRVGSPLTVRLGYPPRQFSRMN